MYLVTSIILALSAALAAGCAPAPTLFTQGGSEVSADPGQTYRWTFDDDAGPAPADFITVLGEWARETEPSSPSTPNVLRQKAAYGNPDFPRIVIKDLTFADLTVRVRCRAEAGGSDQACGLMFRVGDSENYYITRANALEGNVRLYRVVNGSRQQFATANAPVASGQWHTLEAAARGDAITVRWDGAELISTRDGAFDKGKIGLWTKADSVTAFDDLEATAE